MLPPLESSGENWTPEEDQRLLEEMVEITLRHPGRSLASVLARIARNGMVMSMYVNTEQERRSVEAWMRAQTEPRRAEDISEGVGLALTRVRSRCTELKGLGVLVSEPDHERGRAAVMWRIRS